LAAFTLASPGQRLVARIIDGGILFGGFFAISPLASALPYIFLLLFFTYPILYEVTMVTTQGATFGKMVMNIHIIDSRTGANPEWGNVFLRWLILNGIWIIPLIGIIIGFSLLWDPNKQGWQDMAANTYVVQV